MPAGRCRASIRHAGGHSGNSETGTAEEYDPTTGAWTFAGSMTTARQFHTATLMQSNRVLVTGGYSGRTSITASEIYDPVAGTWMVTGAMLSPRALHSTLLLPSGHVLATGGLSDIALTSAEVYTP
jgi:hypothetical protein